MSARSPEAPPPTGDDGAVAGKAAYYAGSHTRLGDWRSLLHPPYTIWHLSYVAIGAALAPRLDLGRLLGALGAFFLAVGVAAHAFDELRGRPLGTRISGWTLWAVGAVSLLGSVVLCVLGIAVVGPAILVLLAIGMVFVLGYNLELLGGRLHTDRVFAISWGAYPVLVAGWVQSESVRPAYLLGALGAYWLSRAQRALSLRAREIRRRVEGVEGALRLQSGETEPITAEWLLQPIEVALRSTAWALPMFALAAVAAHWW